MIRRARAVGTPKLRSVARAYVAFGITLIQAIPAVVAAEPGIKGTDVPPVHWRRDQRLVAPLVGA
jgi:hypothetical protein